MESELPLSVDTPMPVDGDENVVLIFGFDFEPVSTPLVNEVFYPFGNYKKEHFTKFTVLVNSPSPYYYTDVFATFVLDPQDALDAYKQILEHQQVKDCAVSQQQILDTIPDHESDFDKQFLKFYNEAYKNVIKDLKYN